MQRAITGSMTAPSRIGPAQLAAAQQRLQACAQSDPAHPQRTPLPLLPAKRVADLHRLAAKRLQAQAQVAAQWGQWAWRAPFDPQGTAEAMALGMAFWQQWMGLQAQWTDGLAGLAEEAGDVHEANTVSKAVVQEINLVQQAMALSTAQAGLTLQLLENAQNNLGFWLARRTGAGAG
ncbi:MAG: hypothetical protein QE285_00410 [Aquabacterium sp.]|nr:hypothetical protein [Aquabacterium sp.]